MIRDQQRQRVYEAGWNSSRGNDFRTLAECQEYVDKILASAWIRARWGNVRVRVERQRLGGQSHGGVITLGVPSQNERVILHELAHELNFGGTIRGERAAHGPEFAAIFLALTRRFRGTEAAQELQEKFRTYKVRYRAPGAVPAPTRPVESKTAVAARQRAKAAAPLTITERREAARLLRRAVAAGAFGDPGRKPRAQAQALARHLERE